jgi:hypothetical protein
MGEVTRLDDYHSPVWMLLPGGMVTLSPLGPPRPMGGNRQPPPSPAGPLPPTAPPRADVPSAQTLDVLRRAQGG